MSKRRYGKDRVAGCYCTDNLTCGECLKAAKPWHFTPSTATEQAAQHKSQPADKPSRL